MALISSMLNLKNQIIMKTTQSYFKTSMYILVFSLAFAVINGCSKESTDPGPEQVGEQEESEDIKTYLNNLSYNPDEMLNVQSDTGTSSENLDSSAGTAAGITVNCSTDSYNIRSNFENVAIFDPGLGVIYPGALVKGNSGMLDGVPEPLQVPRAPTKLRVLLPGIGSGGNVTVDDPSFTNVDASIDEVLEYWNSEIATQGYEIDSDAYFESTTAYSSQQFSLDLGVSAEWSKGSSFEGQFQYGTSTTSNTAAVLYRQVFYDVIMESPASPASVLADDVSLADIKSIINAGTPPAYVSSVSYGRIIMIRLEAEEIITTVNLAAALEYAAVSKKGEVDVNSDYEEVLEKSTISVVTIGGNAEVASQVITGTSLEEGPGSLNDVIGGENALYSRDNPGAPIAYTIKYLKDDKIAKMGYSTDYTATTCSAEDYFHDKIKVINDFDVKNIRVKINYDGGSDLPADTEWQKGEFITIKDETEMEFQVPPGAYNVDVTIDYYNFGWNDLVDEEIGYVSSKKCYRAYNPSGWENSAYDNDCKD